jgi:hypothetical protein
MPPCKSDWHNCLKLGCDIQKKKMVELDRGLPRRCRYIRSCFRRWGDGVIPLEAVSHGTLMGKISKDIVISL